MVKRIGWLSLLPGILLFSVVADAGITGYTSRSAFEAAVTADYTWDFESETVGDMTDYDGPGTLHVVDADIKASGTDVEPFSTVINGQWFYMNPMPAIAFTFDAGPIDAFGLSVAWLDTFNSNGVTLDFYDASDAYIDSVTITKNEGTYILDFLDCYPLYDGFIGAVSTTPIGRIDVTVQFMNAVYFDDFIWVGGDGTPIPLPGSGVLLLGLSGLWAALVRRRKGD